MHNGSDIIILNSERRNRRRSAAPTRWQTIWCIYTRGKVKEIKSRQRWWVGERRPWPFTSSAQNLLFKMGKFSKRGLVVRRAVVKTSRRRYLILHSGMNKCTRETYLHLRNILLLIEYLSEIQKQPFFTCILLHILDRQRLNLKHARTGGLCRLLCLAVFSAFILPSSICTVGNNGPCLILYQL